MTETLGELCGFEKCCDLSLVLRQADQKVGIAIIWTSISIQCDGVATAKTSYFSGL